jgi:hypothetical protein
MAQMGLASALSEFGEREGGTARLEEALAAFDAALELLVAEGNDNYVSACRDNCRQLKILLDERRK